MARTREAPTPGVFGSGHCVLVRSREKQPFGVRRAGNPRWDVHKDGEMGPHSLRTLSALKFYSGFGPVEERRELFHERLCAPHWVSLWSACHCVCLTSLALCPVSPGVSPSPSQRAPPSRPLAVPHKSHRCRPLAAPAQHPQRKLETSPRSICSWGRFLLESRVGKLCQELLEFYFF